MTTRRLSLDFALDPDDATLLPRSKALKRLRNGRAKTAAVRIVWHDDADGALAEAGVARSVSRGEWREERLSPGNESWLPAHAPPTDPAPGDRATTVLIPWAAFEGRSATYVLGGAAEGASLTMLDGVVRAVTAERRISRAAIAGPEAAVASLALALAGELRVSVPRASLAAEALAAARDRDPPARRLGAPALAAGIAVGDAFGQIVGHLADVLIHWALAAHASDRGLEPVHQMRVALRRLRSAMGLFRSVAASPVFDEALSGARALGRVLGPARDWDVFCDGGGADAGKAFPDDPSVKRLLGAASRRRLSSYAALSEHLGSADFRRFGVVLALLAAGADGLEARDEHWDFPLQAFAARGLQKRWRAMTGDVDRVGELPIAALHAIRLDGKRLRYACEFFAPAFPGKSARRFVRRLSVLQEELGALNDGAVAAALLAQLTGTGPDRGFAAGAVLGMAAADGGASRERIKRAWDRFRRLEPFWG